MLFIFQVSRKSQQHFATSEGGHRFSLKETLLQYRTEVRKSHFVKLVLLEPNRLHQVVTTNKVNHVHELGVLQVNVHPQIDGVTGISVVSKCESIIDQ